MGGQCNKKSAAVAGYSAGYLKRRDRDSFMIVIKAVLQVREADSLLQSALLRNVPKLDSEAYPRQNFLAR